MKTYLKEAAVAPLRVIIGDGDRDSRQEDRRRFHEALGGGSMDHHVEEEEGRN